MRSRVRAVLLGFAVLGSGTWAEAQCTKDTDCKGERVCDAGQCTAPPAASATAVSSAPSAAPVAQPPVAAAMAPAASPRPPLAEPPRKPQLRRRNPPLMVTGIVMTSAGPLVWLLGLTAVSRAQDSCLRDARDAASVTQFQEVSDCRNSSTARSSAVLIAGAVLIGAGIPMLIYGSKKVPGATATLAPVLAPGHAGLQLRLDL